MKYKHFEGLTTEIDIKTRYKLLAKQYHPDLGGCAEIMKTVNAQYEKVLTGAYQIAGKSITEIDDLLANDLALRDKLNAIVALAGLNIEICGAWIWVTGQTFAHKTPLKTAGYLWSKNKQAWYWRSEGKRSFNRKTMELDQIRSNYGSFTVPLRQCHYVA